MSGLRPEHVNIASLIINKHKGCDIGAARNKSLSVRLSILEGVPTQDIKTLIDTQPSIDLDACLGKEASSVESAFRSERLDLLPILDPSNKRVTPRCLKEAALVKSLPYLGHALEKIPVQVLEDPEIRKRTFTKLFPMISPQAIRSILGRWPKAIHVYQDEDGTEQREDLSEEFLTSVVLESKSDVSAKRERIEAITSTIEYGEDVAFAKHDKAYLAACRTGSVELSTSILSKKKIQDPQGLGRQLLETALSPTANVDILTQIARSLISAPVGDAFGLQLLVKGRFRAFQVLLREECVLITPDFLKAAANLPGVPAQLAEILNTHYRDAIAQDGTLVQEISTLVGRSGAQALLNTLIDVINPDAVFAALNTSDVEEEVRSAMYDTLLTLTNLNLSDILPACIDLPAPTAVLKMREHRAQEFQATFNDLYGQHMEALVERCFAPPRQLGLLSTLHQTETGILTDQLRDLKKRLEEACREDAYDVFMFFVGVHFKMDFQGSRPFRLAFDNKSVQVYSYFVENYDERIHTIVISDNHLQEWIGPDPTHQDVALKLIPLSTEDQLDEALVKSADVGAKTVLDHLLTISHVSGRAGHSAAFRKAVQRGSLPVVQSLAPYSNPGAKNSKALFVSASNKNLPVFEYLLTLDGIDPNAKNGKILDTIAKSGNLEILQALLASGRFAPTENKLRSIKKARRTPQWMKNALP